MNSLNNTYPTVATIIGCPEELTRTDGLLATPIILKEDMSEPTVQQMLPNDTSSIKDPIQKAVVDNILGNVATKAPLEKHRCDLCNIEVSARAALISHLSGARHARKLKEEVFDKEPLSPYIEFLNDQKMYRCNLCNTTLNAKIQIIAHLQGSKHKNKSGVSVGSTSAIASLAAAIGKKTSVPHEPGANVTLLLCSTCNIHVNSETQMQQHTSSRKHLSKVSSSVVGGLSKMRATPYPLASRNKGDTYRSAYQRRTVFSSSYRQPQHQSAQHQQSQASSQQYSLSSSFVPSSSYSSHSYSQPSHYRQQPYPHTANFVIPPKPASLVSASSFLYDT